MRTISNGPPVSTPALRRVDIDDKYAAASGLAYMSGTQVLVRLALLQRERDAAAGLNTAGYISGYRGSPLGAYDQALQRASKHLDSHNIKFVPGTNEDLAATAVWGTQQINLRPGGKYDGVFGIWYGKGPGVDRSGDAFRHANQAGTAPHGGVLALAGDDHSAKSSTMAAQTDHIFMAVGMPVLAPATLQDFIDLGLHGFAMSRFAGVWVGFKCVTDCVEVSGIVDVSPDRVQPVLPADFDIPEGGLHIRWPETTFVEMERRLNVYKLPAVLAYARANRLDRVHFASPAATRGIVTSGKAYLDLMQALADLGIGPVHASQLGVKVYRVVMPWPLEPEGLREFAAGCTEILVIEEKRGLIEAQVKEQLYGGPGAPRVIGKRDAQGQAFVPDSGELNPGMLARLVAQWLGVDGPAKESMQRRLDTLAASERASKAPAERVARVPYFCSGCPHNSSTKVPEGSRALAGIGCHYMAQWMDRETETFTHMGGEGMTWVGQAPFVDTEHVFQNLGDGTYFHSGYLALRHAVATSTRITYKILYNDAVAMTGGQEHDGQLTPATIANQVLAEGVQTVVVVTDEPAKYPAGCFAAGVEVYHRSDLDAVQRRLREMAGVTVLIFDQTCAAEKRRRRKKGAMPEPNRRAFINEAVCEGCGDCGVQSNCVSIEPVDTEFGRKRRVNQQSCNKDLSCVTGFCPSFVTVEGGRLRKGQAMADVDGTAAGTAIIPAVPDARVPAIEERYAVLVTGIGGTGVVTIGQILGMAAHLEGKAVTVLDMAGLAQKGGAVMSHLQFAASSGALYAPKLAGASVDAVIGCDLVVSAGEEALSKMLLGKTSAVINTARTPTGEFARNADWSYPEDGMLAALRDSIGTERLLTIDAAATATALLGDAMATNLFLLGLAYQRGLVPVGAAAIERAIELNGVAVQMNRKAFAWGRAAAVDPNRVQDAVAPRQVIRFVHRPASTLHDIVARREEFLTVYQDAAYAGRYRTFVDRVATAEAPLGSDRLAKAVARYYFKLMAYKDEYEVARLYSLPEFKAALEQTFEGDYKLTLNLAPPLLAKRNAKGELVKREFGPWLLKAFSVLARLRRLRGTVIDVFGYTAERRMERRLICEYEAEVDALLPGLCRDALEQAVKIASLPDGIRGYGHVKERRLRAVDAEREQVLGAVRSAKSPLRSPIPETCDSSAIADPTA